MVEWYRDGMELQLIIVSGIDLEDPVIVLRYLGRACVAVLPGRIGCGRSGDGSALRRARLDEEQGRDRIEVQKTEGGMV